MTENKISKCMKLSDFYGALKDFDFSSASEIREVMQDKDKDINFARMRAKSFLDSFEMHFASQ